MSDVMGYAFFERVHVNTWKIPSSKWRFKWREQTKFLVMRQVASLDI